MSANQNKNAANSSNTQPDAHPRRQRRQRQDLEELAAEFVNSRLHRRMQLPAAPPKVPKLPTVSTVSTVALAAGGGAALALVAVLLLWPASDPGPEPEIAPSVSELELMTGWLEVERMRKREEFERSRKLSAKMAAADGTMVKDLTERAPGLAARAGAAVPAAPSPSAELKSAPTAPVRAVQAQPSEVAAAPNCAIHVSDLSSSGRLTYADVARMKGARTDERGHVFTPPVAASGSRAVVFEVLPSGCVQIVRTGLQR